MDRRESAVRATQAIARQLARHRKPHIPKCVICLEVKQTGTNFPWTCLKHQRCCIPCLKQWGNANTMRLMVPCPIPKCKAEQDQHSYFAYASTHVQQKVWTREVDELPGFEDLPGVARCPTCGVYAEKTQGCSSVICPICTASFRIGLGH